MNMTKRAVNYVIIAIVLLGCGIAGYSYWHHHELYPSTDDAYVNAHTVDIAAQVNGPVVGTYVQNYDLVQKGQLLFSIDPKPFELAVQKANAALNLAEQKVAGEQAAVKAATAHVTESRGELLLAEKNAHRMLPLVHTGRIAQTEGDEVIEKLSVARAALEAAMQDLIEAKEQLGMTGVNNAEIRNAKAALEQAQLDLQHTHVYAPSEGRLINFNMRVGDMISPSVDLFTVIEQNAWWVDTNFKETDLKRIRVGQSAIIYVDIYPDHAFRGVVANISQGSGSAFSLLPAENATGNWVKVTQRFPIKVEILNPSVQYPLRVGASASVTINTSSLATDRPVSQS